MCRKQHKLTMNTKTIADFGGDVWAQKFGSNY